MNKVDFWELFRVRTLTEAARDRLRHRLKYGMDGSPAFKQTMIDLARENYKYWQKRLEKTERDYAGQ